MAGSNPNLNRKKTAKKCGRELKLHLPRKVSPLQKFSPNMPHISKRPSLHALSLDQVLKKCTRQFFCSRGRTKFSLCPKEDRVFKPAPLLQCLSVLIMLNWLANFEVTRRARHRHDLTTRIPRSGVDCIETQHFLACGMTSLALSHR